MSSNKNTNNNAMPEELRSRTGSDPLLSNKHLKETQNLSRNKAGGAKKQKPTRFGISFDVDGVLARGTIPIPAGQRMIRLLQDEKGDVKVPVTFVTNSLNRDADKAQQISSWLGVPISAQQMIHAPGPLELFKEFHKKHCLVVGQGRILEIAQDLGFENVCTLDQVKEAYPLLDMVDHENRRRIAREGYTEKPLARIEAIIMMGEPRRWESFLQLLVDLLVTDGKPDRAPDAVPEEHLPIIACNMDLLFMDRACMPRYGHGAFLLCLEALYKKVTGRELKYTALVGKPSEITFRYAEHCLSREAKKLGIEEPLQRMYLVGDTPEVDIVGANLYQRYLTRLHKRQDGHAKICPTSEENGLLPAKENCEWDPELPGSRNAPSGSHFNQQTVSQSLGVLVCTGVYQPGVEKDTEGDEKNYHGHRDFPYNAKLYQPTRIATDVEEAVRYILEREGVAAF
jgi:HAD superfamily hydrolase (TIGR01456 family)